MTSFIVCSTDKKKRQDYIKNYCQQLGINPIDITVIEKETAVKANAQSIGIGEIKLMQKKLFFKPIKSPTKAVVLEDAQLLTTEAQNAMLKVLEEPPENTIIMLSANSKEAFLPTIISRCKMIELEEERGKPSEGELVELREFVENLPRMRIGEKLKLAEDLAKDKEKALLWIERMIMTQRDLILKKIEKNQLDASKVVKNLKTLQESYKLLKTTNASARFILENTLLRI